MNQANPPLMPPQLPSNPLSINIQFNINNTRGVNQDLAHMIRGKKLQPDILNLKSHICACQSKTPDLAQTDRDTYSKEMEYLRPVEDRKKKIKRNSMDIQLANRSINQLAKTKFIKGNTTVLKKTDLSFKQDAFKKKRNSFKNDLQPYRRSVAEPKEVKSQAIDTRSEKKTIFHKSLKNIIHKMVNNELSKRSLTGMTSNKIKSPYHTPNLIINTTARKRPSKKKNIGSKSERGLNGQYSMREQIVQKLNSLKSMTNSILRSQIQQNQMPYYSKKKGRIHIKTDHSIDLIEEIVQYQKKSKKSQQKRDVINKEAINQTNRLIQTYIYMNDEQQISQKSINQEQKNRYQKRYKQDYIQQNIPQKNQDNPKKIKEIITHEMQNLFSQQRQLTEQLAESKIQNEEKGSQKQQSSTQKINENTQKLRAFMSSEMERPATLSSQLQKLKLQQLKKQQIQKWGYLLEFIKKNMHSDEADTETVLNQVYWFLERSKNDLQKDLNTDRSIETQKKEIDDDFTVKYSQKRQQINQHYYQEQQHQKINSQQIASFKEEYTQQNQDLKLLSLQTISNALKQRQVGLDRQRQKQIAILEQKRENGKIAQQQYQKQLQKIQKWNKKQLAQIKRAKKNIWKGYHQAKGVLDKTVNSRYYEERQSNSKKMMKCLSQSYLKKPRIDYKTFLQKQKSDKSHSSSQVQLSSIHYEEQAKNQSDDQNKQRYNISQDGHESSQSIDPQSELSGSGQLKNSQTSKQSDSIDHDIAQQQENRSQQMQQIKQRLLLMKREHYGLDQDQDVEQIIQNNINYEQIEKSLQEQYSDEEISIINKEIGQSLLTTKNTQFQKYRQLDNKLKYICSEDKQDIFQFIFLDLCIQLYQEPCKDNKIMKSINNHVSKAKNQSKKKKGVKTNLNVVKQYLKRFSAFLMRTNKTCLLSLNMPMGPTALEMLRYMHDSDYDIPEQEEQVPTLIIPITVFDKFQQSLLPTLQFQQYYDDPQKQQSRINFLKTILHIHNKALFDSLNEFLDHQRPFGIWGKPFPWKKTSSFTHAFSQQKKQQKLKKSVQKVIQQCSYVCGLLIDKEQSLVGNAKISESYVQQIREDRLSRMLANELVQSEQRWLFYDDEQTEVLVEISSYVWNLLLYEVRNQIAAIMLTE